MLNFYFKQSDKASLPEIDAYMEYFSKKGHSVYKGLKNVEEFEEANNLKIDVVWEVKGVLGYEPTPNKLLIHDYPSLSTGFFPLLKNRLKRLFNPKPDLRLFLNKRVREGFGFKDDVPFLIRDMGVHSSFLRETGENKEHFKYDFLYVGVVDKSREIDQMLRIFTSSSEFEKYTLCLIGNYSKKIFDEFRNHSNIIFKGRVPYHQVSKYISESRVCVNYIPNKYPFNIQTSTKMLEYLSMGKPVLTTNYEWANKFERNHGIVLPKIEEVGFSIDKIEEIEDINDFNAVDYEWNNMLDKIKLNEVIVNLYDRKMK